MSDAALRRGGAAVGVLDDLDPVEAAAVKCLRMWSEGEAAQRRVFADFEAALGASQGQSALGSLDELCGLCARHGRRPLMRHGVNCRCLGADEACFAHFVASTMDGDTEDAMMMATLLVRADIAPCLLASARSLAMALHRMTIARRDCRAATHHGFLH